MNANQTTKPNYLIYESTPKNLNIEDQSLPCNNNDELLNNLYPNKGNPTSCLITNNGFKQNHYTQQLNNMPRSRTRSAGKKIFFF